MAAASLAASHPALAAAAAGEITRQACKLNSPKNGIPCDVPGRLCHVASVFSCICIPPPIPHPLLGVVIPPADDLVPICCRCVPEFLPPASFLDLPGAGALVAHTALAETSAQCEETYGIFPCSTSLPGTLLLIAGYGYMLLQGANLISDGSELLLEVMDPGLIGGLLLPILGALPDAAMIVVSGTGGSVEEAQEDVAVGIGTLAGSTVMLLSIAWGGSLILGRCDLENDRAVNKKLTKGWHPTETGVTSDKGTRINAYIMIASAFLYLFPQTPTFLGHPHNPTASLAGSIACLVALVAYCIYQVVYPELQKREKEAAHQKFVRQSSFKMAAMMAKHAGAVLIDEQVQQE